MMFQGRFCSVARVANWQLADLAPNWSHLPIKLRLNITVTAISC